MDIKQLKAAVQLAKIRVGSDPSNANKSKLEYAQQQYEDALNPAVDTPEKKTPTVETEDGQDSEKPKPAAPKAAQAKPKTQPQETTRTVPEEPQEPETPEPKPTEAK